MAHLPEGLGQPTRISYSKEPRLPVDVAQVIINYNTTQNINSVQCCNVLVCFPIYQSRVYPIKHTTQKARSDKFNCQIPCPALVSFASCILLLTPSPCSRLSRLRSVESKEVGRSLPPSARSNGSYSFPVIRFPLCHLNRCSLSVQVWYERRQVLQTIHFVEHLNWVFLPPSVPPPFTTMTPYPP